MTASQAPRLLTVVEVEKQTGIARWRMYQLLKEGKGPRSIRIGRTLRISAKALSEWIAEQERDSTNEEES